MSKSFEIIYTDFHGGVIKQLKMTDDIGVAVVGISLENRFYRDFLAWAAEQQPPVTIPEGWPTL